MKRAGMRAVTPHGFMLEAVAGKAELAEHRANIGAEAEQRYTRIVATGKTIPRDAVCGYLEGKATGKTVRRPTPRRLAR